MLYVCDGDFDVCGPEEDQFSPYRSGKETVRLKQTSPNCKLHASDMQQPR